MGTQVAQSTSLQVLWDDNQMLVFQFQGVTAGFASGSPLAETVRSAFRNSRAVTVVYDDSITTPYTTANAQNFSLNQVYSLVG